MTDHDTTIVTVQGHDDLHNTLTHYARHGGECASEAHGFQHGEYDDHGLGVTGILAPSYEVDNNMVLADQFTPDHADLLAAYDNKGWRVVDWACDKVTQAYQAVRAAFERTLG